MQFLTIMFGLIGLFTLVLASEAGLDLPYPTKVFQYNGEFGGYDVQLNGTVQEIHAQVVQIYPDFKFNFTASSEISNNANLKPRNKNGRLCCPVRGQPWQGAQSGWVGAGLGYLENLGDCWVDGRTCVRVSCVGRAAIYLCNDNDYRIDPACIYIAIYATDLVYDCTLTAPDAEWGLPAWNSITCGQEFDSDNYNVIVRDDTC